MYLVHLSDVLGEGSYDTFCEDENDLVELIRNLKKEYELDGVDFIQDVYFDYTEFINEGYNNTNLELGGQAN